MIKVYFVRHAEPEHGWEDEETRPLTAEGRKDSKAVLDFFRDKDIFGIYCSPYRRSIETLEETARLFNKRIVIDERLRERKSGPGDNVKNGIIKRWADFNYHEEGGESISMVQERNMAALKDILSQCQVTEKEQDISIIIGTHGTALGSILNYFDSGFNCHSFLRILDWMPYIVELDFSQDAYVGRTEHFHIEKFFEEQTMKQAAPVRTDVRFYKEIEDNKLEFAVIVSRFQGKWVLCRHQERDTYEAPGGHREPGEAILMTAIRELQEETGAIDFELEPVCMYSVSKKKATGEPIGRESFGLLCFAEIQTFKKELHCEIESVLITKHLPKNWTYPDIQPKLIKKIKELGYLN